MNFISPKQSDPCLIGELTVCRAGNIAVVGASGQLMLHTRARTRSTQTAAMCGRARSPQPSKALPKCKACKVGTV